MAKNNLLKTLRQDGTNPGINKEFIAKILTVLEGRAAIRDLGLQGEITEPVIPLDIEDGSILLWEGVDDEYAIGLVRLEENNGVARIYYSSDSDINVLIYTRGETTYEIDDSFNLKTKYLRNNELWANEVLGYNGTGVFGPLDNIGNSWNLSEYIDTLDFDDLPTGIKIGDVAVDADYPFTGFVANINYRDKFLVLRGFTDELRPVDYILEDNVWSHEFLDTGIKLYKHTLNFNQGRYCYLISTLETITWSDTTKLQQVYDSIVGFGGAYPPLFIENQGFQLMFYLTTKDNATSTISFIQLTNNNIIGDVVTPL